MCVRETTRASDPGIPPRWLGSVVRTRTSYRVLLTIAIALLMVMSVMTVGGLSVAPIDQDVPTTAPNEQTGVNGLAEFGGSSPATANQPATGLPSSLSGPNSSHTPAADATTTITLVTGDQVAVTEREGERIVSPMDDDDAMRVFTADNETYAIPSDIDLTLFPYTTLFRSRKSVV